MTPIRSVLVMLGCVAGSSLVAESPPEITDLLRRPDGSQISTPGQWSSLRRHWLDQVRVHLYGSVPQRLPSASFKIDSQDQPFGGQAVRTRGRMVLTLDGQAVAVRFGLIRPRSEDPVPVVIKNDRWVFRLDEMPEGKKREQYARQGRDLTFREVSRRAVRRGYAICKFLRDDVAADDPTSPQTGIRAFYPRANWSTISAWAWAYQPLIDHLIADHRIAADRIIATGHSRGGKTALLATILDPRIAIAAPSASGSGGTGSMQHFTPGGRRQTPSLIASRHAYWFVPALAQLDARQPLPVDGHTMRALVAPRGIINTQGIEDPLANPRGTKMMFDASEPVFALLGVGGRTATYWHAGGHQQTVDDWEAVLDYSDAFFAGAPLPESLNNWPAAAFD